MTTDMFCHWNYVLEGIIGQVKRVNANDRHPHPDPLGRAGPAVPGHRRRRLVRHLRARDPGRDPVVAPDQLLLGRAGLPRRAGRVPGRRHPRLRGRRAEQVRRPAARAHPQAGVEPGPAGHRVVPRPVARGAGQRDLDNGFKRSGRSSCATSSPGASTASACCRPPAGSSSPSSACSPPPSAAPSTSRRSRCDRASLILPARRRRNPRVHPASRASRVDHARPLRDHLADRVRRGPRRPRDHWPTTRPGAPARDRLGHHAGLPARTVVVRARRRRRHGHRAARHGPGLGRHPGADQAHRSRGRRGRRPAGLRRRHRPARPGRPALGGTGHPTRSSTPTGNRSRWSPSAGATVIVMASRALAQVARTRRTTCTSTRRCCARSTEPVILHWLGTDVRPGARRLLGQSDDVAAATETFTDLVTRPRRQGRRRQGLAAGRRPTRRRCGPSWRAAGAGPALHRATTSTTRS